MVETPSRHVQRPERTNHNSQNEITGSLTPVTCAICEASYAPSNLYQRFLQVSPIVLESAYMSMCHFCFRCRRPACPECWDTVHGICGACVQEANLPFRTQVKPLDGILFPPLSPTALTTHGEATQENTASSLFVRVTHGRFHPSVSPSNDISNIQTIETATIQSIDKAPEGVQSISHHQEQLTPSEKQAVPDIVGARVYPSRLAPAPEASPTLDAAPVKRGRSIVKKVELVLTVIVLLALLAIAVMISLAEYFPAVNTFINHLLHIDIRAEIAYLLHLVQQHL